MRPQAVRSLTGGLPDGTVLEFRVPDRRLASLYTVRVVEVAGDDHGLLNPTHYRAANRLELKPSG